MSMNQRVSLYCCESALSPVRIARSSSLLVRGERVLRTCRTIASVVWVVSDSCGRYVAENGCRPGIRWVPSRNSTRAGDSSSTIWKSESCRKFGSSPAAGA
jgi:hypothetical protein